MRGASLTQWEARTLQPSPWSRPQVPETEPYSRGIHRRCTRLASTGRHPRGARHPHRCTRPC